MQLVGTEGLNPFQSGLSTMSCLYETEWVVGILKLSLFNPCLPQWQTL